MYPSRASTNFFSTPSSRYSAAGVAARFERHQAVTPPSREDRDFINPQLHKLSTIIVEKRDEIHTILSTYQTHHVTTYEIDRSIRTLNELTFDTTLIPLRSSGPMAVLLPSNLPLYSLVIFGLIPALLSEAVYIRPNAILQEHDIISRLYDCLTLDRLFPSVHIINENHEGFKKYIAAAQLVVFTGSPANAGMMPESVLVVNGTGHNPIVVTNTADIDAAVEGALFLKGFNGGQDCAGPDAILVHADVAEEFTAKFQRQFSLLKIGSFNELDTVIGPIHRETELYKFSRMFHSNKVDIISGGTIDFRESVVTPTVIVRGIERYPNFKEIYGPVAFIHPYKKDADLAYYFRDPDGQYNSNRMYVSVYGHSEYISGKDDALTPGAPGNVGIVLQDKTIHDVEIGYKPYGGYSVGASCVIKKQNRGSLQKAMPIYLPEIITNLLIRNDATFMETHEHAISELSGASVLRERDIDPVIVGFKKIVLEIFGANIRFAFVFGSAAKGRLKVKGDDRDDLDTLVCLERDDSEATAMYKSQLAKLHQEFGLKVDDVFPAEIMSFETLDRVVEGLAEIDVSIHSLVQGETFDHIFWAHAITDKKTGFVGDGKALSGVAKQVMPHVLRWRNQIMEQLEHAEVVPEHISQHFLGLGKSEIIGKMDKLSHHLIVHLGLNYADENVTIAPRM